MNEMNEIDALCKKVIAGSVASGSRVFGGATEESDYDYIVPRELLQECFAVCREKDAKRLDYNNDEIYSYSIPYNDKTINFIIPKSEAIFTMWSNATECMIEDMNNGINYAEKSKRVHTFDSYKHKE